MRRRDPTFYWATRRLPSELRPPVHALYGYVRHADDLVDSEHRAERRRADLDAWERELDHPVHPMAIAIVDAGGRHRLPLDELRGYLDAMRTDTGPVHFRTWEELDRYADGSAGTVGRIMATLLDVPEAFRRDFGRLGQAFQIVNHLRDVREDHAMGRVYIPAALDDPNDLRMTVAEGVARARARFVTCNAAIEASPPSVRPGIRMARSVYESVLDQIEASCYDVLGRRTKAKPRKAAFALLTSLRP
ncbi:MAG: 15-cis-phytoene synthase [Solirubrobacteraceae bacterium]|jgi:phytoene synthase|nr:15-cis-phytoene synthase [Solirubrobacteraceae bacterium]